MQFVGDVVCSIIERNGKILLAQRPKGKSLELKWEFPGGKVRPKETEVMALKREIKEELQITIDIIERLTPCFFEYKDFSINLIPYRSEIKNGVLYPEEHARIKWVDLNEAQQYDLAEADQLILKEYIDLMEG